MKISMREKIMLLVLSLVGLLALSYYAVFSPQLDKIQKLTFEESDYMMKVEEVKLQVASIDKLEADIKVLEESFLNKTIPYYPEIIQEKLIIIMDDIVNKTRISLKTISFGTTALVDPPVPFLQDVLPYPLKDIVNEYTTVTKEKQADNTNNDQAATQNSVQTPDAASIKVTQVESMDITMQIEGSYEQWLSFIKEIEALKRMVVIKNLAISSLGIDKLSSEIQIAFFALPKIREQDAEYLDWPYKGIYGKINPFEE